MGIDISNRNDSKGYEKPRGYGTEELNDEHNYEYEMNVDQQIFHCEQCDYKSHVKANFKAHLQTNHKGIFACDECDKKFNLKTSLDCHVKSVHEGIKYNCNYCSFKASTKTSLKRHTGGK